MKKFFKISLNILLSFIGVFIMVIFCILMCKQNIAEWSVIKVALMLTLFIISICLGFILVCNAISNIIENK